MGGLIGGVPEKRLNDVTSIPAALYVFYEDYRDIFLVTLANSVHSLDNKILSSEEKESFLSVCGIVLMNHV